MAPFLKIEELEKKGLISKDLFYTFLVAKKSNAYKIKSGNTNYDL